MKDVGDTHLADIELNHHIQRQILNRFLHSDSQTYTDLLVDGMSGNSFIYHLKALLREKLILKSSVHTYEITPFGRLVLDNISFETSRFRLRPTIGVFLVAQTKSGEYMLYESARQPFIGMSGFVFGKSRIGQDFTTMIERIAGRRLITSYKLRKSSAISIIYRMGGEIVSHRTGIIALVDVDAASAERVTDAGKTYWAKPNEFTEKALKEISQCLAQIGEPYIELDVEL